MPQVDLPLAQLQEYRPSLTREPGFDGFWEATLQGTAPISLDPEVVPVHFRRAVDIAAQPPYTEIAAYCRTWPGREAEIYRTLSYFDGMNLAGRITCPVLMNVGLQDVVCPPSTIYAAFNHLASTEKEMKVFPYNGHEGNPNHLLHKLHWARRLVFDAPEST